MSSTSSSVLTLSSFNLLFFTQVLTVLTTTIKYNEYVTDKGKNISIPCIADGNIMWVKENGSNSTIIQTGKFLVFTNVTTADRGIYVCFASVPTSMNNTTGMATISKGHGKGSASGRVNDGDSLSTSSIRSTSSSNMQNALSHASWQHHQQPQQHEHQHQHQHKSNNEQQVVYRAGILEPQYTTTMSMSMSTDTTDISNQTYAKTTSPLSNSRDSSSSSSSSSTTVAISLVTETATKPTTTTTLIIPDSRTGSSGSGSSSSSNVIMPQNNLNATMATQTSALRHDYEELEYQAFQKVNLSVRTTPGPVTQLYFKASTILGFLIWRFNKSQSGGYPVRSFTAEYRNVSYRVQPYNSSYEHEWSRMDPINIAPNVRQMEVYHLEPNTTYEFRIWANNLLGSGDVITTNVTTLPETKEEDLIRLIQPDLDNFDPRIWIIAVSIVLGTLVILAIGLCIVLSKECYQSSQMEVEDGWDSIELIPNIILNPGFSDSDGPTGGAPHFTRTVIFDDDDDDYDDDYKYEHEPTMEKFKRKVSVFFTGPTIKRI